MIFCFISHLLLDATGIARVLRELLDDATASSDADLFRRQIIRLCTAEQAPALAHWRKMTGGAERFTRLPVGHGSAAFVHDEAASAPELLQSVCSFCARRNVTVSALLHLAAGEALMELLDLPQVSFASTSYGRDAASAQLVGMFLNHFPVLIRRGETPESVQEQLLSGMRYGYLDTEDLPPLLALSGMDGALKLNVENAGDAFGVNSLPDLMRGDVRFAAAESAAASPPQGINGELTLMVFLKKQFRLDFYYSPASVDRAFVRRFAAALLSRLRRMTDGIP